ncbi:out at first protein-like [Dreissena polymorpha]|uniref:Out at first protein n=1 Tax=Dreissena polymorpha TaxID=45954 RepID=A0A9D3YN54_DREPO|nr:out at first protein-like [Dreissena polymorpha]KAH3701844.1 hypothetical protein DPMN_076840 [Dreissena polymorpha]
MAGLFHCTLILSLFTCTFIAHICGQLVINVKNNGGDVERQSIEANTTADTVLLEFLSKDGTHVTQFIDFKSDVQVFKVYVPWEEERGIVQPYPQVMCFVTRFGKNEFISSDAMSKLRQKNPTAIRSPEEDRGMETRELNLAVNLEKSGVLSPYLKSVCENAADAIYAQDSDIKLLAQVLNKDLNAMMSATNSSVTGNGTRCKDVSDIKKSCLCQLHICIGWYPCGLKYCRGKDSSGKVVNYRCGIKTCKRCLVFKYPVNQKMLCLWDDL